MRLNDDRGFCPRCEQTTEVHAGKPWLGGVCLNCGATVAVGRGGGQWSRS